MYVLDYDNWSIYMNIYRDYNNHFLIPNYVRNPNDIKINLYRVYPNMVRKYYCKYYLY